MSSVNQAFIRAYSKDRRSTASSDQSQNVAADNTPMFASVKKDSQGHDTALYHRVNAAAAPQVVPEPWVSTIEVVGIMPTPIMPKAVSPLKPVVQPRLHPTHSIPSNHFRGFSEPQTDLQTETQSNAAQLADQSATGSNRTTLRNYIEHARSEQTAQPESAEIPLPNFKRNSMEEMLSFARLDSANRSAADNQRTRQTEENLRALNRGAAAQRPVEPPTPIHPVWEVDRVYWPEVTDRLLRLEQMAFHQVGRNLRATNETGLKILAVTSIRAGAGRSTVAMCLARIASEAGLKVALVDADLANPTLAEQLNLEFPNGWEEAIADRMPLDEAAIQSVEDGITVFPFSVTNTTLNLAADHPKVRDMLLKIAHSFDLVILDCNQLGTGQGKILGAGRDGVVDAAILVVDGQNDREDLVSYAMERIQQLGIESIGLVENCV
jgi:Mrp family chromosome partitioning ATPase